MCQHIDPWGVRCGHLWNWVVFASHCAYMHQIFCTFLRHIGIYLDHFGGCWHTFGQSASTQNWAELNKYMGKWEVNISASVRAPYINFWRLLRPIRTFLDNLRGVDTPMGRGLVPNNLSKLSKYKGEWWSQYNSFYYGPIHQILLGGSWDTTKHF